MTVTERREFVLHDHDLKKLLGLPRKAQIQVVESATYSGGGEVMRVTIKALVRSRTKEVGA